MPSVRGMVLIVLDTFRADYGALAGPAELPNLGRLRRLCGVFPRARCGSFPTGPMRTDLLTGRLSFLDDNWAKPAAGEMTLPRKLREAGFWSTLVADTYVAVIPRIGGTLLDEFDSVDFIRGAGSDPWMTPAAELRAQARQKAERRLTRSIDFEVQYLANVAAWRAAGGPPARRLFEAAARASETLAGHSRFLLWVDAFAGHEPWCVPDRHDLPAMPLFPAYVESDMFPPAFLDDWKRQYGAALRDFDTEIGTFVDALQHLMEGGDVALAVVSDHGFLFGEYGFVGKPPNTPLPPELHDAVCWLSQHFLSATDGATTMQPHRLHEAICRLLEIPPNGSQSPNLHVFGRNSPRSAYIGAATEEELYYGEQTIAGGARFFSVRNDALDPRLPLVEQGVEGLSRVIRESFRRDIAAGRSDWIQPFQKALSG